MIVEQRMPARGQRRQRRVVQRDQPRASGERRGCAGALEQGRGVPTNPAVGEVRVLQATDVDDDVRGQPDHRRSRSGMSSPRRSGTRHSSLCSRSTRKPALR